MYLVRMVRSDHIEIKSGCGSSPDLPEDTPDVFPPVRIHVLQYMPDIRDGQAVSLSTFQSTSPFPATQLVLSISSI